MRKSTVKAEALAVVFGVMGLAELALCPFLAYQWRDSVRSEAQYRTAPPCTSPGQGGCRRMIESVVKGKYYASSRGGTTRYVSLSMPGSALNGDIPVWWETDHSLYGLLKPGDGVTAEEWEGQVVAIRGAAGGTLRTEYDPTYRRKGHLIFLTVVVLMTALIIFIEYKLIRSIRRARLSRG
jgi:hypothetical protein